METTIINEPAMATKTPKQRRRRTLSVGDETYANLMKLGQYRDSVGDIIDRLIESHRRLKEIEGKGQGAQSTE